MKIGHEIENTTEKSIAPLIRLAHPLAFAGFLRKIGTPVDRLFAQTGLPVYCDDPSAFVPLRRAWMLFDAATQLEDPGLGWHVGRFVGDKRLSAGVLKQIEHAPTLYQALFAMIRLARTEASDLRLGVRENRDDIHFCTQYRMKDWSGYGSSQAYQLAVYIDMVRHYAGRHWMPSEIGIESPNAPNVLREHYPASRIVTGQPFGYIAVSRSCLHHPPPGVAPETTENGLPTPANGLDFVGTVRAVIQTYLPDGYPSARKVACLLDTTERTLFRNLANRGIAYQVLADETRFETAKKLLREDDLPQSDIAGRLGFSDPGNFSRMFRRIGGLSPREFRTAIKS